MNEFNKLFESLMDRKPVILDEDQIEDIRQLLFYSEQYEIDSNKLFDGVRAADHYENYLDNVSKFLPEALLKSVMGAGKSGFQFWLERNIENGNIVLKD